MTGKRPSSLAVRGLLHAEDEGRSRLRGSADHRAVQLERRRWDRGPHSHPQTRWCRSAGVLGVAGLWQRAENLVNPSRSPIRAVPRTPASERQAGVGWLDAISAEPGRRPSREYHQANRPQTGPSFGASLESTPQTAAVPPTVLLGTRFFNLVLACAWLATKPCLH